MKFTASRMLVTAMMLAMASSGISQAGETGDFRIEEATIAEDPWSDLWFYSSPVFVELRQ